MLQFELPYPPSINHYWRAVTTKHGIRFYITPKGNEFRKATKLLAPKLRNPICDFVKIEMELTPPDKRVRDIDNVLKPVLDALLHARIIDDDYLVSDLNIKRIEPTKPGKIKIIILPLHKF